MAQLIPARKLNQNEKQNVKVVVRVRPLSRQEAGANVKAIIKYLSQKDILAKDKRFHFDQIFKPEANQLEVYQNVVAPMIPDVISGYNCTVFAYGQTGSGKTFTMTGNRIENLPNWRTDLDLGFIPRAAAHVFDLLSSDKQDKTVRVSYLELYNEEIRDLLTDDETPLNIYNDLKGSILIQGLTEVSINSSEGICRQLEKGNEKRQTAPTLMNHQSSRSHTVFTITVFTKESTSSNEEILKTGKINFVDLAGSENIARSGCKDKRAVELANINRSLLTLGRVIHALADKFKKHVPYRDSKLTRILQDSLGGHTKTCILATISPAANSLDETLSTLEYACRARDIKNSPVINEKLNPGQVIESLFGTIRRLEDDLEASRSGVGFYVSQESYASLIEELDTLRGDQHTHKELIKKKNKQIEDLENKMEEKNKAYEDTVKMCQESRGALRELETNLAQKKEFLVKEHLVAKTYQQRASQLHKEVKGLVTTSEMFSEQSNILQKKLHKQYTINKNNEMNAVMTVAKMLDMLNEFSEKRLKLQLEGNICKSCKRDILEFKTALQIPFKKLKNAVLNFDRNLIQNVPIQGTILPVSNEFVRIAKTQILDIKMKSSEFFESRQIAHSCISEYPANVKSILERLQNEVHDIIKKMNDLYKMEDLEIAAGIEDLQKGMSIRMSNREIMHRKCLQRDETISKRMSSLHTFMQKRQDNSDDRLLTEFNAVKNESTNEIDGVIGNFVHSLQNLSTITPPYRNLDIITDEVIRFSSHLESETANLEQVHKKTSNQALNSLGATITTHLGEVSSSVNANYDSINCKLSFILEDKSREDELFNNFIQKSNEVLNEEYLKNVLPTRHEGDTPARQPVVKRKPLASPAPRAVLLQEFKALPESTDDDETATGEDDSNIE